MLSDLDIFRAAHFMMHEHGGDAELEAAISADRMLRARPQIIESTSDRVNMEFTTVLSYHIWWW